VGERIGSHWVIVQHVGFEGPGSIAGAIRDAGREFALVRVDRGEPIPEPESVVDIGGLVVMGGPMSVHDAMGWLEPERALLRAAVGAGLPVLGVCLGAQQLAYALGGSVAAGPVSELGVGEVHLSAATVEDPVFGPAPSPLPCVHWHGDTFTLPDGAVRLAGNDAYENQAFRVGACAYGLQFHVEVTASLAGHWAPHLPPGMFVRASDVAHVSRTGEALVRRFVALAGGHPKAGV
jgi:GMP synthase (glutamine-hydrolysing)